MKRKFKFYCIKKLKKKLFIPVFKLEFKLKIKKNDHIHKKTNRPFEFHINKDS